MAAAAVTGFADPSGTWDGPEWSAVTLPFTTHTPQWTELDVNERLTIISRLWLLQRTLELNQVAQHRRATTRRPLAIPNPTPKRSRLSSPLRDRKLLATGNVNGPTRSGECAQRRLPSLPNGEPCSLPPSDSPQPRDRSEDALFRTSIPEACCDLSSADGIIQHAGKKKKNKNQSSNYNAPDKKDAGGAGDGGSGNGGNQNGDTGNAEGGSAGSGNGDDKKNGSSGLNPDDDGLGTFAAVGKKKKKGANEAGKTLDLLGSDPKLDTFDEIKLDDTGPSPGLKSGGGKATISLNPFSSWGTSWNTGITTDAASTQASDKLEDKTEDKKEEHNFDAWGSDQPKQKEKTKIGFSLGGFAEAEKGKTHESSEEKGRNEFDFGFASAEKTEKKKKKSSFWDAEPEAKPDTFSEAQDAGSAAVDNPWGSPWADAQTTKKKTKKGAATFLDPAPDSYKPEPVASTPDDDFWAVLDTKNSRKGKKAEKVAEPDTSAAEPTSGVLRKEDTQKSPQLSITKEKEKEKEDKEKEKDKGKDKDKDKDKKKKKDKVVDPEPDSTKAPAKPVKDPKPDAMPESEPRPAAVVTPAVEPVAAPSAPPAAAPVITPAPPPVKESGGSAWNFWGATRKVIRTAVEQIPAEPAPAAENNEEGWIWGKKDNKKSKESTAPFGPDTEPENDHVPLAVPEVSKTGHGDDSRDTYSASKDRKKSTDGSLVLGLVEAPKEESESEGWSWGFRKEKKKSPPPAPTPPPINTDATASDKNANASSGPQIETEPDPVSTMLAADIVAEENELALLQAKKLKRGLSSKHQRRLDELIKNANDRAEQAATKKAEEKMKQEAEANSAAEALQVQESTNDAAKALEAEIAAEEDELEMLKIKINKASKGNKKLNWGDQQRFDELTQRANTRANLAATEANVSGYTADKQATFETKQQAMPEAEVSTTDGAEERASESKKQAVLETDIPGEEEELEKLQIKAAKLKKNRRLSAEDQLRLDELSRRAEARAAAATATAATTIAMEANAEADRKDSRTALESEEPVTREKNTRADREAEEQAAHEADEADKAELAALQKKRKLLKADKRRIDKLTERINARAVSADADRKNAKTEIDEQAARKAEEQLALEAEKQAKAEADAAREAEEADDAEFEALTVRLERKRKLPIKDQERLDILTQKIRSRVATTTPGREDTPIQIEESATPETRDQATLEAEEQAALEVATQAARDAEAMETEWREATRRAEEDADDAELENLTTKLKKNKRLTMQDQKRFDILTDKVNARTAIRDSAEDNVQASIQIQETPKTMEQGAAEVDEQAYLMTAEQAECEAEKVAAARKADEAADDMELEELTTKLKKKKRLSSKDQARLERLTKKVNDRVAIKLTDNGNTQTGQEIEEFSAHEAEISHAREVEQAVHEAEERSQAKADKEAARKEEAARKVEEADDEELDALRTKLRKKKKLSSRDQDRYDKLTEKINARVAVATLGSDGEGSRKASIEIHTAPQSEEEAFFETSEPTEHKVEEMDAACKTEEDAEDAEHEFLSNRLKSKKKLSSKDQERLDKLTEKIKTRVVISDPKGGNSQTAQETEELIGQEIEELALHDVEQRDREVEEQAHRAEKRAAAAAAATRKIEEDKEDDELESLKAKLKKKKRLSTKDQERLYRLNQKINARTTTMESSNNLEKLAARRAEGQTTRDAEQAAQAIREAQEQAARERQEAEDTAATSKSKNSARSEGETSKSDEGRGDVDDFDLDLDLDDVDLTAEQADEILSSIPPPAKPRGSEPFSFWGAKNILKSPPPGVICTSQPRQSIASRFGFAEPPKASDDATAATMPPKLLEEITVDTTKPAYPGVPSDDRPKKTKGNKLTEKLKKFEPVTQDDSIDVLPKAPSPPLAPQPSPPRSLEDTATKLPQTDNDNIPGGFPTTDEDRDYESVDGYAKYENKLIKTGDMALQLRRPGKSILKSKANHGYGDEDEDVIVDIIDSSPVEKKTKKSKKSKWDDLLSPVPPPAPPPPPAAPDSPDGSSTPSPEVKPFRRERVKISRDESVPRDVWPASAAPRKEERISPIPWRDIQQSDKEREDRVSSKGSSSDRIEQERDDKVFPNLRSRMDSHFQSTPPLSRSISTRENKVSARSSSRHHSVEMSGGLVSPALDDPAEMTSKAARILGVDKSRSLRNSRTYTAAIDDDVVVMDRRSRDFTSSPDKPSRRRPKVKPDDNTFTTDPRSSGNMTPLKRSSSNAKKGISGLFGGLMHSTPRSEPRPEPRRRSTYHVTDDEGRLDKRARPVRRMSSVERDIDPEREARRAARRAKKEQEREQEQLEEARRAKEARRERRRRLEEEQEEMRRQEEREARRAERRAAREREAQRIAYEEAEAKEAERAERRRLRRLEKEAAAVEAEAAARRAARTERRRSQYVEESEEEAERRRRREARRAEKTSRHRSEPLDDYRYAGDRPSRYTDDERRRRPPTWPHSGTSSWVKDHVEGGRPPHDGLTTDAPQTMDDEEARRAARRATRRREKYDDTNKEYDDDQRRRRARREERERRERRLGGSDSSREKAAAPRESFFTDTPRSSWWRKLTGS